MDILIAHLIESMSRLFFYETPKDLNNPIVNKKRSEVQTVIVQEPTTSVNRRGPDDYTPINLRHDFDKEWVEEWCNVVDIEKYE